MTVDKYQRRRFLALASQAGLVGGIGSLAGPATAAAQSRVTGVRFHADANVMKMHLDLDTLPEGFRIFKLPDPSRVVVDIVNSRVATLLSSELKARGTVRRVRYGKRNHSDLRIVLDVNGSPGEVGGRLYEFTDSGKYRLVVDLAMSPLTTQAEQQGERNPEYRSLVVAIDAGHGGRDPGALGYRKTREKDVTLKIAYELEKKLKARKGYQTVLTRSSDSYMTLAQRVNRAREMRADLLVSIHADAYPDKSARGSSVFVLSRKGASSKGAALLARAENQSDKLFGQVEVGDADATLSRVLVDMSQNAVLESSIACGQSVLKRLSSVNVLHKSKVERAGFAVLRAPDVPSILVETAFISNPREERKLRSRRHQRKIAGALADGIADYFANNAPPDSYIAKKQAG